MMQDMGSVSAYTDAFFQTAATNDCTIIHHNLIVLGGGSGSPMIGASGRVIGLCSAGDVIQPDPVPQPVSKLVRAVVNESGKPLVSAEDSHVQLAILETDGLPVFDASSNRVMVLPFTDRTTARKPGRAMSANEQLVALPLSAVQFDASLRVTAVLQKQSRIPIGFRYSQRVDMLKELIDGTAEQNLAMHEREWNNRIAQLNAKP